MIATQIMSRAIDAVPFKSWQVWPARSTCQCTPFKNFNNFNTRITQMFQHALLLHPHPNYLEGPEFEFRGWLHQDLWAVWYERVCIYVQTRLNPGWYMTSRKDPMQSLCTARIGQIVYYTVYDLIFGDFPAKNTVYSPYVEFWPTLYAAYISQLALLVGCMSRNSEVSI